MKAPNYTQVSNEFIEQMHKYKGYVVKVFLAISRKTIGWHKDSDRISQSQLKKMTGLSRNTIKKAIDILVKDGWINQTESKFGYFYDLNIEGGSRHDPEGSHGDREGSRHDPTKKTNIKETNIKDNNAGGTEKKMNDATKNSCCSEDIKNQVQKEGITLTKLILDSPDEKVQEALQRFRSSTAIHEPGNETAYFIGILKNVKTEVLSPIPDRFIDEKGGDEGAGLKEAEAVYQGINARDWTEEDQDALHTIYCNLKWNADNGKLQKEIDKMLKIAGKYKVRELKEKVCEAVSDTL